MFLVIMGVFDMSEGAEKWVISGIELQIPMKPILTKPRCDGAEEEEGYNSTTPTSAESRIPSRVACPPPPKKRKAAASRCHYARVREFFRPPDLETIFTRRLEGA